MAFQYMYWKENLIGAYCPTKTRATVTRFINRTTIRLSATVVVVVRCWKVAPTLTMPNTSIWLTFLFKSGTAHTVKHSDVWNNKNFPPDLQSTILPATNHIYTKYPCFWLLTCKSTTKNISFPHNDRNNNINFISCLFTLLNRKPIMKYTSRVQTTIYSHDTYYYYVPLIIYR